jgi:galactokinase
MSREHEQRRVARSDDDATARSATAALAARFRARFAGAPRLYRAPGRINLIGEHTDYNEGFVLPAAVDLDARVAAAAREDRVVHLYAADLDAELEFRLDEVGAPAHDWRDYARGTALALEQAGHRLRGADLLLESAVPIGAGLSSSAAIEVVLAWALLDLAGVTPDPLAVARLCQRAENEFVGARVGIMDQFAACHGRAGHVLLLDCRSLAVRPIALPPGLLILVCDSMVKHTLASGAYNDRRAECEAGLLALQEIRPGICALRDVTMTDLEACRPRLSDVVYRRCRHVIGECARVLEAGSALERGDLVRVGRMLTASHASLRDDYEVSCGELDTLVAAATAQRGVYGSRLMGGGFGGSTITLLHPEAIDAVMAAVADGYQHAHGVRPWMRVCRTADGAQRIR